MKRAKTSEGWGEHRAGEHGNLEYYAGRGGAASGQREEYGIGRRDSMSSDPAMPIPKRHQ